MSKTFNNESIDGTPEQKVWGLCFFVPPEGTKYQEHLENGLTFHHGGKSYTVQVKEVKPRKTKLK